MGDALTIRQVTGVGTSAPGTAPGRGARRSSATAGATPATPGRRRVPDNDNPGHSGADPAP